MSDERVERIRQSQIGVVQPDETILYLLDRLAASEAARAALVAERADARRWAVRLEQRLARETEAAYKLLFDAYGIPQPAAPAPGEDAS